MLSSQSLMPAGAGTPRHEKRELWFGTANWHGGFCYAPARFANCACGGVRLGWAECRRRRVYVGGGIAVGVLSRNVSAWIPACAGMTNSGGRNDENADWMG